MAGVKQHFLPRFLLKGFFSKVEGHKTFVWQFQKDVSPLEVSIRDTGHSQKFYGRQGVGSLDELITTKENNGYSASVERTRGNRKLSPGDEGTLVEFVHSLALRTRSLRETLEDGFQAILDEYCPSFTNATTARQWLLTQLEEPNPFSQQWFTDFFNHKRELPNHQQERSLKKHECEHLKDFFKRAPDKNILELVTIYQTTVKKVSAQVSSTTKKSHNNILRKVFDQKGAHPTRRFQIYRQLQWRVQSLDSGSLILGDIAVLQVERDSGRIYPAFDGGMVDFILLPLSHDLLCIGPASNAGKLPSLNEINCNSAELSRQSL